MNSQAYQKLASAFSTILLLYSQFIWHTAHQENKEVPDLTGKVGNNNTKEIPPQELTTKLPITPVLHDNSDINNFMLHFLVQKNVCVYKEK